MPVGSVPKTVLLLGHTGKLGMALEQALGANYRIIGKNSSDFDATDFEQIHRLVEKSAPDIVVNTVAMLGIDPCEQMPEQAFRLNALLPRFLAELSATIGFTLVHFSTDAVFSDRVDEAGCVETDTPIPLNLYGSTKYAGDCFVMNSTPQHYIFRVPVLFGFSRNRGQFVEKMLERLRTEQQPLRISTDIISSPTYSLDVAERVRELLDSQAPYGLYHLANYGRASLFDLMTEMVSQLGLELPILPASYRDFPFVGRKNTCTPLSSVKTAALRPWQQAVSEYCALLRQKRELADG